MRANDILPWFQGDSHLDCWSVLMENTPHVPILIVSHMLRQDDACSYVFFGSDADEYLVVSMKPEGCKRGIQNLWLQLNPIFIQDVSAIKCDQMVEDARNIWPRYEKTFIFVQQLKKLRSFCRAHFFPLAIIVRELPIPRCKSFLTDELVELYWLVLHINWKFMDLRNKIVTMW